MAIALLFTRSAPCDQRASCLGSRPADAMSSAPATAEPKVGNWVGAFGACIGLHVSRGPRVVPDRDSLEDRRCATLGWGRVSVGLRCIVQTHSRSFDDEPFVQKMAGLHHSYRSRSARVARFFVRCRDFYENTRLVTLLTLRRLGLSSVFFAAPDTGRAEEFVNHHTVQVHWSLRVGATRDHDDGGRRRWPRTPVLSSCFQCFKPSHRARRPLCSAHRHGWS